MQTNQKLHNAKRAKDDEFYTPREYVEELLIYLQPFKQKRILCPCDSEESFYFRVLKENGFNVKQSNADFRLNPGLLPHNGRGIDRSLWDWAEIIITNPPFSLAIDLVKQCLSSGKKFVLLVNILTFYKRNDFNKDYFLLSGIRYHDRRFKRPNGEERLIGYCDYIQNILGRLKIKGYNPPIYKEDFNLEYMKTQRGVLPYIPGGALPIPGAFKGEFLAPISCLFRIDEKDYVVVGTEKKPYLNGKEQFSKIILKYREEEKENAYNEKETT